jgi:ribosomal subunit interface protein
MKIVIKTKNLKLNRALEEFIEEKINSLEKFSKIFYTETYFNGFFGKGKPKIEAWVEVGKTTLHHQKGPWFYAECQMRFPKKSLRSVAQREDLKLAICEVKDELQRELKQYKEKLAAQTKRRARVLKKELKLAPEARFYRKGRIREEGL